MPHVVPPFFVFQYILSIRTYSPTTNNALLLRGRRAGESARFSSMTALILSHRNPSTSSSVSPVVARELGRLRTATPIHLLPSSLFSLREQGARVWGHVVVSRLGCRVLRTVSFFFSFLGCALLSRDVTDNAWFATRTLFIFWDSTYAT